MKTPALTSRAREMMARSDFAYINSLLELGDEYLDRAGVYESV